MNITISKFSFEIDDKYSEYPLDYVTDECRKVLEEEVGIPMKYIEKNCDEDYIKFVIKSYFAKHEIPAPAGSEPVIEESVVEESSPAPVIEEVIEEPVAEAPAPEVVEEPVAEAPAPAPEVVEEPIAEAPAPAPEVVEEPIAEAPAPAPEVVEEPVAEAPAPALEVVEEPVAEANAPEVVEEPVAEMAVAEPEVVVKKNVEKLPEISLEQFKNLTLSILLMNEDKRRSLFGTSDTVEILKRNSAEQIAEKFAIFTCSCGMDICYIEANIPAGEKFEIKCPKCGMPHLRKKKAINQGISIVGA